MTDLASIAYALPSSGRTRTWVHRAGLGPRPWLFTVLVTGGPEPTCVVLGEAERSALGTDLFVVLRRDGLWSIEAVRPGISSSDDELVGKLWSHQDGSHDWIVPVTPTPRGQVLLALMMSIHASRGEAAATVADVGDDAAALQEEFGMSAEDAAHRRLCWRSRAGTTLLLGRPEDHHDRVLGLVLEGGSPVGQVLLHRDGSAPEVHLGGYSPLVPAAEASGDLRHIVEEAVHDLWS